MWETIREPEDGWTQYERMIMRDLIVSMYRVLGDTTDRFILAMICECGYSQTEVSHMIGLSQVAISKRFHAALKKVRTKRKNGRL